MKKTLLLLAMVALPLFAFSQTEEKQTYSYNIVTFSGSMKREGLKVNIDNGKEIKKLVNEKGEKIVFKTTAAALMYFLSEGWELYVNGATSRTSVSNGDGSSHTTSYWILRKPCTKEYLDSIVKEGIKIK